MKIFVCVCVCAINIFSIVEIPSLWMRSFAEIIIEVLSFQLVVSKLTWMPSNKRLIFCWNLRLKSNFLIEFIVLASHRSHTRNIKKKKVNIWLTVKYETNARRFNFYCGTRLCVIYSWTLELSNGHIKDLLRLISVALFSTLLQEYSTTSHYEIQMNPVTKVYVFVHCPVCG